MIGAGPAMGSMAGTISRRKVVLLSVKILVSVVDKAGVACASEIAGSFDAFINSGYVDA